VLQIAKEMGELAAKARDGKLGPADMQGGCFSISSLGGIGGTAFTPIINAPEVAILGVSKSAMKPVWNGKDFVPRLMLPLSLSYDHRVIDGAGDGARFTARYLATPAKPAPAAAPPVAIPGAATYTGKADIECEMLVLGAGPGGYTAAFRAADLGMKSVVMSSATRSWAASA
jgi:hypothetical protein